MTAARFPTLLSPLRAGRLSLRNRVMMSGHMTLYSTAGVVGPRLVRYYAERARGGVAAVVTEAAAVHPATVKFPEMMRAYDPRIVPELDVLADAVHEHGARMILQLAHGGARMSALDSDLALYAPSAGTHAMYNEVPRVMTLADIAEARDGYVRSAANVARSRLDGVEVHAAHGYLPVQFVSPVTNDRTDAYGGSLANRVRFLLEVLTGVREVLGEEKILGLKLNGTDATPDGCTVDDYVEVARLVAETGTVDYVTVSVGTASTNHLVVPAMPVAEGTNVDNALRIRAAIDVPVFPVGRIYRPEHAESVLTAGVDGVALARALIADPYWVAKAAEHPERIRPCIAVNQGCFGYLYRSRPITCLVNPRSGKEAGAAPAPVASRRVAVVGAGPAGCEAAITAADRGHTVTLFEADGRPGGLLNVASAVESRRGWADFLAFQRAELSRLGVDVRLGTTAGAADLVGHGFDDVVLAIGSRPSPVPAGFEIDGGPVVLDAAEAVRLTELAPDAEAVVVDEVESMQAYVPVEHLAALGARVHLVTTALAPGGKLDQPSIVNLMQRLGALGVRLSTSTRVVEAAGERSVVLADVWTGRTRTQRCTHLVLATHRAAAPRTLAEELTAAGVRVSEIGDCLAPRTALEAVREGRAAGEAL